MLLDRHMKTKITKINKKLSAIFNPDWEKYSDSCNSDFSEKMDES